MKELRRLEIGKRTVSLMLQAATQRAVPSEGQEMQKMRTLWSTKKNRQMHYVVDLR